MGIGHNALPFLSDALGSFAVQCRLSTDEQGGGLDVSRCAPLRLRTGLSKPCPSLRAAQPRFPALAVLFRSSGLSRLVARRSLPSSLLARRSLIS